MPRPVGQNVCELFVVVGWDDTYNVEVDETRWDQLPTNVIPQNPADKSSIFSISLDARVIDQYPLHDEVPNGLEYFCFPLGLSIKDVPLPPQFHSFIHTTQDASRLIGCVLTFSEEISSTQRTVLVNNGFDLSAYPHLYVQKGICLLSHWPFLSAFKKFLTGLYQISLTVGYVPIERYIANFIDDVPAPTSGKIDISYFLGDEAIQFQCPPLNEPNAWSGFPLFPLFECLSAINIVNLFGVMLTERPVLFISSQYSLLTLCCEAMTSLLYPFRWAHPYIPILPSKLIGALSAPFPCIFGVFADVYQQNSSSVSPDTVRVFLDDNRVDFGSLGPPPKFPDGRYKKLINAIIHNVSWLTKSGDLAYTSQLWKLERLSLFDDALTDVTNMPMDAFWQKPENISKGAFLAGNPRAAAKRIMQPRSSLTAATVNDQAIREAFLKFFVAMLKDYKRFLVYVDRNEDGSSPMGIQERFRFDDFVKEQPSEWRPLLESLRDSQAFSNFIDDRIALNKLDRDVIFFDESIEAKLNRYTFRSKNFDTPFLTYEKDKHIKTYVPPSPMRSDLTDPDLVFQNDTFPRLQEKWFVTSRNLAAKFAAPKDQILGMLCRIRLKRKVTGQHPVERLTGVSCVYSSYLIVSSLFISHTVEVAKAAVEHHIPAISTLQVLQDFTAANSNSAGGSHSATEGRAASSSLGGGRASIGGSSGGNFGSHRMSLSDSPGALLAAFGSGDGSAAEENTPQRELSRVLESADIGLKVSLEILNALTRASHTPDEITYRILAEACADTGRPWNLLDIVVFMDELGFMPDHQIRTALVRALTTEKHLHSFHNRARSTSGSQANPPTVPSVITTTPSAPQSTSTSLLRTPTSKVPALALPAPGSANTTVTAKGKNSSAKTGKVNDGFPLSPAEVWNFQQWGTLHRKDTSVLLPSTLAGTSSSGSHASNGHPPEDTKLTKLLFGPSGPPQPHPTPPRIAHPPPASGHGAPSSSEVHSSNNSSAHGGLIPGLGALIPGQSSGTNSNASSTHEGSSVGSVPTSNTTAATVATTSGSLSTSVSVGNLQRLPAGSSSTSATGSASNHSQPAAPVHTNNGTASHSSAIRGPLVGTAFEGYIPHLHWAALPNGTMSARNYYAASSKLQRQVKLGESALCAQYPGLEIDFTSPVGMKCPSVSCPLRRVLTIAEVHQGWATPSAQHIVGEPSNSSSSNSQHSSSGSGGGGDYANRYTSRCIHCGTDFIPRFSVRSTAANWQGSEGPGSTLWCEFLSPWTLHKEVLNIIFEHGVTELLSQHFRDLSHQRAVVFWNLLVAFRLRGLPMTPLLTNASITEAFPPKA